MKKVSILRAALVVAGLVAGNVQAAAYITGVTATTSFTQYLTYNISQITDGSGLTALSLTATAATITDTNTWVGNGTTGTIDFNLHGSYSLSDLAVWNFNSNNIYGVNGLTIFTSTDGSNFSVLAGAPTQFAIGSLYASEAAQLFSFAPVTASYVRFAITSNWSGPGTGLSEIGFGGTAVNAVPEPSALALFAVGALGFAVRRRRAA